MSRAYLTIDDAPTKLTPKIMDYLVEKEIVPVINVIGQNVGPYMDEAVYAVKKGAIIGNHSYSHPHFSTISKEEAFDEIKKTEILIDQIYRRASIQRVHKVFRFPYGDKGGKNEAPFQKMLQEEFHFERLDDTKVQYDWWKENHLDTNIDMHWTFDFEEYKLVTEEEFTWESILKRIHDKKPPYGGVLLDSESMHIVLIHDTVATDEYLPDYYKKIIDYVLEQQVEFITPSFIH